MWVKHKNHIVNIDKTMDIYYNEDGCQIYFNQEKEQYVLFDFNTREDYQNAVSMIEHHIGNVVCSKWLFEV